jgi:YNFM family putative membrane transporter
MRTSASFRTGLVVAIACAATCCAVAIVYSTQAVFSDIAAKYGIPLSDARLSFSVCSIAYALAFFVLGPLSDVVSARWLAAAGLSIAAAATAITALTSSAPAFLAASAIQGASTAAVPVAMFALLPRLARKEQLGTFFGLIIAASVLGITLGRAGMGLLTAVAGLSGAQLACALMLLVMAALLPLLPAETLASTRSAGVQAYGRALRMLASSELLRLFATGFLLFFGYLGTVTFLTLRLHAPPFALDSATIGVISLLGLGAIVGAPVSGRLTARYGSLAVGTVGLCIVAAAIACLALARTTPLAGLGLFLIFLGTFVCQPAVFVRIAERVPADRRGSASSLYLLTCLGAGSLASAVLGPLWLRAGWHGITTACLAAIAGSLALLASDGAARRTAPLPST